MFDARADAKVVVAGAGPVGLAMAIELARHGVPCRILDRAAGPARESRAIVIQPRTLELFRSMGVVDAMLEVGHRIHGASIFAEGKRILHFSYDELASPYPFALDLPQSDTERVLTRHLESLGVQVEYGVTVTALEQNDAGVTLHAHGPDAAPAKVRAEYAAGCDGARSTIRRALRLPFEGTDDEEHFVLADLWVAWDGADDEWYLWFHEEGLFSLFPLPGGLYRVIAEVNAEQAATPVTFELVQQLFTRRGPKGALLGNPAWLSPYRIKHRQVKEYRTGRVFLAGDAAHVQSPAGGQGMNTGIQDACNLGWKLAMVLRGHAPESLLDTYTAEREPVARSVLALTGNLSTLATLRHPVSQQIRNRLIPILAGFDVLEHRLVDRLAEISVNYRRSPAVGQSGRWYTASPIPGDRALDAPLGDGHRLLDMVGLHHVVLMFASEHPQRDDLRGFENIARYMRDGYPGEVSAWLVARTDLPWQGPKILDSEGHAHHAYSAAVPCVYLIRPDGYVGFRSLSSDPLPLLEHLNRLYEPA